MEPYSTPPTHVDDAEFSRLMLLFIENDLSAAETSRLRAILMENDLRRTQFADFTIVRCVAKNIFKHGWPEVKPLGASPGHRRLPIAPLLIGWALAATVVLGLFATRWFNAKPSRAAGGSTAGIVTRQVSAQWAAAPQHQRLTAGITYRLNSGFAQIVLASGVQLLVNAPAQFQLNSPDQMFLNAGKIVAKARGGHFTIHTPSAVIKDLGTWFAVWQRRHAATIVGVYEGRVLVASSAPEAAARTHLLTTGQAADISAEGLRPIATGAWPQHFVQSIDSQSQVLSLVDLLCGGNGHGNRTGYGIDVATGAFGHLPQIAHYRADGLFHRIAGVPVLDGVFVPRRALPISIDSGGDRYAFSGGSNHGYFLLWLGGAFPNPTWSNAQAISPVLASVDYSTAGHSVIYLHPNKGITINLDAVRRMYPAEHLTGFQAVLGNTFAPWPQPKPVTSSANVWILVDGKRRFVRRDVTPAAGAVQVRVPLRPRDHFLTIADAAASRHISRDWIILGDPKLELSPR